MPESPIGIRSPWRHPPMNIAMEEGLRLELAAKGGRGFFLCCRNQPSVIVGRNQAAQDELSPRARKRQIPVYRRTTGGGAVYHDEGNLNWSLVVHGGLPDRERLLGLIVQVLCELGIPAEEGPRTGIYVNGMKIGGTATATGRGVILFHGTLMVSTDLNELTAALAAHSPDYSGASRTAGTSKGVASVPSELTTLNRVQPGLDIDTLEAHLFAALAPGGVPQAPGALLDLQQIEDRARDFGRESWILHRQPPGRKTKPEAPDAAAFRAARGTS